MPWGGISNSCYLQDTIAPGINKVYLLVNGEGHARDESVAALKNGHPFVIGIVS